MKSGLLAAAAVGTVLCAAPASAQVKIGILNDQSGVYADSGGKYSLEAAKMAVEDFGGEVLGAARSPKAQSHKAAIGLAKENISCDMKKFPVASVPRFFYGPWRLEMLPSVLWASAISFPQPPRALNYAQEYIASASSGAAFHKMQMENEQMKRRNDRQAKQIEELTAQIQQINSAMMANAGVGVPMSSRMPPNMPPAEPVAVAMPRAPSFAGAAVMDVQTLMINQHHPGATSRKGGWPKGKKRNLGGEAA